MKIYSVYRITNTVNGKVYIGYTRKSVENRFQEHLKLADKLDTKWYRAIRKYGAKAFVPVCLYQTPHLSDACEKERLFIIEYQSSSLGYNTHEGGKGGNTGAYHKVGRFGTKNPMFGKHHTEAEKKRIGQRSREAYRNKSAKQKAEWADKIRKAQVGRHKNPISVQKMSETVNRIRRRHRTTFYELCAPTGETHRLIGKDALSTFCKCHNLSLWTVERILLSNNRPQSGTCLGWTAEIKGHTNL